MSQLPIIHKTKLNREQTYFVHAPDLEKLLRGCRTIDQIELNFSDDPSQLKSNYDRYVKHEGKLVILSARYTPPPPDAAPSPEARPYRISVYAILKTLREELLAQFEMEHFATLLEWLNEPRDNVWLEKPHAIQFLINISTEEVEAAYDIDFDSYERHSKKIRFRTDIRRH